MLRKILLAILVVSVFALVVQEYTSAGVNMPYDLSTRISGTGGSGDASLADANTWTGVQTFDEQIQAVSGVSSHGAMTFFYGTGQTAFQVENIIGGDAGVSIWSFAGDLIYSTTAIANISTIDLVDITDYLVNGESFETVDGNFGTMISGNSNITTGAGVTVTISDDQAKAGYIFNTSGTGETTWYTAPNLSATTQYGTIHILNTSPGFSIFHMAKSEEASSGTSIHWSAASDLNTGDTVFWRGENVGYSFIPFESGESKYWICVPFNVPADGTTQSTSGSTLYSGT